MVDFSKAFDSINRVYMAQSLTAYGIRAALTLYSYPTAWVMSTEGLSDEFNLNHGVTRG